MADWQLTTGNWQLVLYAGSSIGRAAVSKAAGCRFDSYPACFMASVTKNDQRNETMADEQSSPDDRAPDESSKGHVVNYQSADVKSARAGGFFTIYKHGQGYWTRMGTAVAAA